jgi:hypothetical protein
VRACSASDDTRKATNVHHGANEPVRGRADYDSRAVRRLALVALAVISCVAQPVQAHTLALAYNKGDHFDYTLHMTAEETTAVGSASEPIKLDIKAKATETVQAVDSSGVADVTISLSGVRMTVSSAGQTTTTALSVPLPFQELKIAPDGRVLSNNGPSFTDTSPFGGANGFGGSTSAVLPDRPVKPGDTWSKDFDQTNPFGTGTIHLSTKSRYLRDETLKGVDAAVVETASTASVDFTLDSSKLPQTAYLQPPGVAGAAQTATTLVRSTTIKGTTTSDVTAWIDTRSRRVLKSLMSAKTDATLSLVMVLGSSGDIAIKGTQTIDLEPV